MPILRSHLVRSGKIVIPLQGLAGIFSDLISPIAPFTFYLTIIGVLGTVVFGALWLGKYKPPLMSQLRSGLLDSSEFDALAAKHWSSIAFAFSLVTMVCMGTVSVAQAAMGESEKGILASGVPAIENIQTRLLGLEEQLTEIGNRTESIQDDTEGIRMQTTEISRDVDVIADGFEKLSKSGGLIQAPTTPEEYYHNARVSELGGNFLEARKSYLKFFSFKSEFIDPHLHFQSLLKAQEGLEGARESYTYITDQFETQSAQLAQALLLEGSARLTSIADFIEGQPEYGPAYYLLSKEYSEARLGTQTMGDKSDERAALTAFQQADEQGKVYKFFVDKTLYEEWKIDVVERLAATETIEKEALETPVSVRFESSGGYIDGDKKTWTMMILPTDLIQIQEIFYRFGASGEFVSTGLSPIIQPNSGKKMPNIQVPYVPTPETAQIFIKYLDLRGREHGPYQFTFTELGAKIEQAKMTVFGNYWLPQAYDQRKRAIRFQQLSTLAGAAKEIRYSFDSRALDAVWPVPESMEAIREDTSSINIPEGARSLHAKIVWVNGEESETSQLPVNE
jgi:hypothetical protein